MSYSSRFGKVIMLLLPIVLAGVAIVAFRQEPSKTTTPPKAEKVEAPKPKAPPKPEKEFIQAKGLHVTGWIAGGKNSMQKLIDMCNRTELNTLVIDMKESDGVVSWDTGVPLEREIGASRKCVSDPEALMEKLKENNIYPIARIVVFKDSILPKVKPEMAVLNAGGGIWRDRAGKAWANPYDKRVWDYNIDLAIEAAKLGFKEIQWDYVRFPSDGRVSQCVYSGKTDQSEPEVIADFLKYAKERLKPYGVVISADLFGLTSLVKHDMGIGQRINLMAQHIDYICPMIYPSHYAMGEYGIPNPNKAPYKTVLLSLRDALKSVEGTKCKVRPWLQDFSLYGVRYGAAEVLAQRKAAKELGVTEFLLWNASCRYTEAALSAEKSTKKTAKAKN